MPLDGEPLPDRRPDVSVSKDGGQGNTSVCPLTGLPDREALMLCLAAAVLAAGRSRAGPTLVSVRLRSLREIEARLGSEARDEAIRTLSDRLREFIRPGAFLARTGGEQFAILLEVAEDVLETENRLGRILEALHLPLEIGAESVSVQSWAGVARFPEGGRESVLLMLNSEAALLIAHEQNVPYRFWYDGLGESAQEKKSLETDLAEAIEHDQLELHFQPLVDAGTGEIQGMEALARWRRPGYGWVPPLEFFPVAQACGLLEALEEWVLRRAASIHSDWRRRGISRGRLSINCVPSFLARPSFAPMVLSILDLQGLDGHAVEFEVAENSLGAGSTVRIESLKSLRENGMRVAIDNFEWGHLSERQLAELPVDRLKIARECVARSAVQAGDGRTALSIIQVAKDLGLDVSAEGVETAAQRDFLVASGCRVMQGFFFARPMTPLDAAVLLRRGSIDF